MGFQKPNGNKTQIVSVVYINSHPTYRAEPFWFAIGQDTDCLSHSSMQPFVLSATCCGVLMVGELVDVKEMCCQIIKTEQAKPLLKHLDIILETLFAFTFLAVEFAFYFSLLYEHAVELSQFSMLTDMNANGNARWIIIGRSVGSWVRVGQLSGKTRLFCTF